MGKRFIGKVIHDVVGEVVPFVHVVNRNDVRMFQRREQPCLAQEPHRRCPPCQLGRQDLDGDGTLQTRVPRQEHRTHAALAQHSVDLIPWCQRFPDRLEPFGHNCSHYGLRVNPMCLQAAGQLSSAHAAYARRARDR
jgi:hypothetical protein